ncbi:MAG: NUDIX domain-containing protein [Marinilabiliaceae bacterium]|nr:NUDIX domain-containing protein [Marinilabiliaceae bacterium]
MDIIDVVCAIIIKNNMILATDKDDSNENQGLWFFPGGKIDESESHEKCLRRHVEKKIGLKVNLTESLPSYDVEIDRKGKVYRMHPYIAEIENDAVILESQARSEWFMPIQLMRLAWSKTDLPIVEEIIDRIIKTGHITKARACVAI